LDPKTLEKQEAVDENIVVLETLSPEPDEDWMPGEFDIA
jgi:hypothetical protein